MRRAWTNTHERCLNYFGKISHNDRESDSGAMPILHYCYVRSRYSLFQSGTNMHRRLRFCRNPGSNVPPPALRQFIRFPPSRWRCLRRRTKLGGLLWAAVLKVNIATCIQTATCIYHGRAKVGNQQETSGVRHQARSACCKTCKVSGVVCIQTIESVSRSSRTGSLDRWSASTRNVLRMVSSQALTTSAFDRLNPDTIR